jgi:Trk K+ transport system NAD-binding subunit
VAVLGEFGVPLHGVDARLRDVWEVADLPSRLASLTVGDCRLPDALTRAGLASCRAVLLVTRDERVNVAAAFAVRALQPSVRIVVRSSQRNLNQLLGQHLGNFVAFEPTQLSAPAFALAALGRETVGLFRLEDELIRVSRLDISADHHWRERHLTDLNSSHRRILSRKSAGGGPWRHFHEWEPGVPLGTGDVITCIELGDARTPSQEMATAASATRDAGGDGAKRSAASWRHAAVVLWRQSAQTTRVAILAALVIATLYVSGVMLFALQYPDITLRDAANVAMVLVLGGFDNLFGQLRLPFAIPLWLHVFSVALSVSGTVGIGILYAFLTERILSARFRLFLSRARPPKRDHVVLVGVGALGKEMARLLRRLRRPLLVVSDAAEDIDLPAGVPVLVGATADMLPRANVATARGFVALTDDDVGNLEAALAARAENPRCTLVIRTEDARLCASVAALVPGARPLGVHSLAAGAFAAAAFGENVHELLHIEDHTILLTEYRVEVGDTLLDRLVGEIAYGYGVIPLLLRRHAKDRAEFFPSDDVRLVSGDRLWVLATIEALRSIEQGRVRAPSCRVVVQSVTSSKVVFEAAMTLARVSGCDVATANAVFENLPADVPVALYEHQAQRLLRELERIGVSAALKLANDAPDRAP